jgi:hypothetical protein
MNRNLVRKLHKWIFVFMGIFMLAWVVSGIVMVLPQWWFGAVRKLDRTDVEYVQARISPAQAIAAIGQSGLVSAEIRNVTLRKVDGRVLYEIAYRNGESRLIDAQNGEPFSFTPVLAERITRRNFDITAPLLESSRLTEHDASYPRGPLPAFRVRFADNPSVSYFLQEDNLQVFRSSILSRLRGAIVSLHNFGPVEMLTGNGAIRHNLLVLVAAVSLIGTLAGLILTLPRGKTERRQRSGT